MEEAAHSLEFLADAVINLLATEFKIHRGEVFCATTVFDPFELVFESDIDLIAGKVVEILMPTKLDEDCATDRQPEELRDEIDSRGAEYYWFHRDRYKGHTLAWTQNYENQINHYTGANLSDPNLLEKIEECCVKTNKDRNKSVIIKLKDDLLYSGHDNLSVPASDRVVSRSDNQAQIDETIELVGDALKRIEESNEHFDPETEQAIDELYLGKRLIEAPQFNAELAERLLIGAMNKILSKVSDNIVTIAVSTAVSAAITLLKTGL